MAAKITKRETIQMAEELIELQPAVERAKQLEAELKVAIEHLGLDGIEPSTGRVFISRSERVTILPRSARQVLGEEMARKIIRVTENVSNQLLRALHEVGDISAGQMDDLDDLAEKKAVVRLHIRPLK